MTCLSAKNQHVSQKVHQKSYLNEIESVNVKGNSYILNLCWSCTPHIDAARGVRPKPSFMLISKPDALSEKRDRMFDWHNLIPSQGTWFQYTFFSKLDLSVCFQIKCSLYAWLLAHDHHMLCYQITVLLSTSFPHFSSS